MSGEFPETSWEVFGSVTPRTLDNGDIVVTFWWWWGGFPVRHTALVYCTTDHPEEHFRAGGWRRGYSLRERWWVLKD